MEPAILNPINKRLHIDVFGAAHLDRLGKTHDVPVAGKSNPGRMIERAGGAGFNCASLLAACGISVAMHTVLGRDAAGYLVKEVADQRGVKLNVQIVPQTATYTAILGPDGDVSIALADMEGYGSFKATNPSAAINIGSWQLIDANLPEREIGVIANQKNFVAAMAVSIAKVTRLRSHLDKIDLLFANLGEIAALCGTNGAPDEMLAKLHAQGLANAVVTDGAKPVWVMENGKVFQRHIEPLDAVTDVTGAGDALTALTLFGLLHEMDLKEAVDLGILASRAILAVDGPYRSDITEVLGLEVA